MSKQRIVIRWDAEANPSHWNVEILTEDHEGRESLLLDSTNPAFPVNVGEFGPLEEDSLIDSIKSSFPGSHVNIRF